MPRHKPSIVPRITGSYARQLQEIKAQMPRRATWTDALRVLVEDRDDDELGVFFAAVEELARRFDFASAAHQRRLCAFAAAFRIAERDGFASDELERLLLEYAKAGGKPR